MLEVVGAIHRIKLMGRQAGELPHIENNICPDIGVKIEQDLLKSCVGARQLDRARLAAHIQQTTLGGTYFYHWSSMSKIFLYPMLSQRVQVSPGAWLS
jgi:hypothetical protein